MGFSIKTLAWAAVVTGVIASASVWLSGQPKQIQGTFGPTAAAPAYIVVNTSTPVLFTAQISDPQLKKLSVVLVRLDTSGEPASILGRLKDDGRNGDLKANDNIYSLRITLNESAVGSVSFKIAARFKPGKWKEPEPDDDDWDRELPLFNRTPPRDRPAERDRLRKLLAKLIRYSLSAPIQVTVDPFPLPPDPGESGKQTLAGIDSDGDAVRDDVQRYIGLNYTHSAKMRAALSQDAVALGRVLVAAGNGPSLAAAWTEMVAAVRCLAYVDGPQNAKKNDAIVTALYLNTSVRSRSFLQATQSAPVFSDDPDDLRSFCLFDPDTLPN